MLYQMETNNEDAALALAKYCELFPYQADVVGYAAEILSGVTKEEPIITRCLESASEHWKMGRITYVDRNVLRIGAYELLFSPDVPPKVAIDEAIELGKKYGNEDSKDFINGILDKVMRDHYGKIGLRPPEANPAGPEGEDGKSRGKGRGKRASKI
jgi:transcription antitermination protein NusB